MLTQAEVLTLHRSLRGERVLSVYIDGSAADPAEQRSWRTQLDHSLDKIRHSLDRTLPGEEDRLEKCLGLLSSALSALDPSIGAPGWAAFVTSDRMHESAALSSGTPTLAKWRTGAYLAPYFRALKDDRQAVVIVADATQATIYVNRAGTMERRDTIHAHHPVDPPQHMGTPPVPGFHTGTRGTTGHDMAQRALLKGRDRMLADTAARVAQLADGDSWIVLGGIKKVTAQLEGELASIAPHRVITLPSLDVHASEAEIVAGARAGVCELRDAADAKRISEIAGAAAAHGLGAVGPPATKYALEQACVRDLYVTDRYVGRYERDAEDAVRAALDQDAVVEEVSGKAAELLDAEGGIAAGLRFRPAPIGGGARAGHS
jgi:hypothetical protein